MRCRALKRATTLWACRGYRITTPLGRVAGVATDLGYVSDEVLANLLLADVVALEANYDYNMLMTGRIHII